MGQRRHSRRVLDVMRSGRGAILRAVGLTLLGCVFLLRLAVPSGWMPVADASGVHLTICTGMGPMAAPPATMMATMAHGHHQMPSGQDHSDGDHPCPYAGFAVALAEPLAPGLDVPVLVPATVVAVVKTAVTVGRGLAAPPPPATGPPLLA